MDPHLPCGPGDSSADVRVAAQETQTSLKCWCGRRPKCQVTVSGKLTLLMSLLTRADFISNEILMWEQHSLLFHSCIRAFWVLGFSGT